MPTHIPIHTHIYTHAHTLTHTGLHIDTHPPHYSNTIQVPRLTPVVSNVQHYPKLCQLTDELGEVVGSTVVYDGAAGGKKAVGGQNREGW